jgi:hypothetical protein
MSDKVRKQIYIEPRQETLLKTTAQQAGVSEAEIIRQALDRYLGATDPWVQRSTYAPQVNLAAWEAEKDFINHVKHRTPLPNGRDWKREDLYER